MNPANGLTNNAVFKVLVILIQFIALVLLVGIERALGWPLLAVSLFHAWAWSQSISTQVYISLVWGWYISIMFGLNPGLGMGLFLFASWAFVFTSRWWEQPHVRFTIINSSTLVLLVLLIRGSITTVALAHTVIVMVALWWGTSRQRRQSSLQGSFKLRPYQRLKL